MNSVALNLTSYLQAHLGSIQKHIQSACPVCKGTGMVCTDCGYGGSVCRSIHDDQKTEQLCQCCVPDTKGAILQ